MSNKVKKRTSRHAAGRAAVKKGTAFENDIADLYRLLGAEVVQNIEISHKKVDLLATFGVPGSSTKHRVIVECKDEKRRVADNQRVMQFHGLLQSARKLGVAESAEIITRKPWSDVAKGYAKENGLGLYTYAEKIAQLIDFSSYLRDAVSRFDNKDERRPNEPPLGSYYVSSSAERKTKSVAEKISFLDRHLFDWANGNGKEAHIAILGEYGTGKTSLCQKLTRDLAESYLRAPGSNRVPVLFNLREFTKKLDIEAFITSFLDKECGVLNPRFKLFRAMNEAGILLMIFDGFDEMAVKVDADTLEVNLQEIDKLAGAPLSKVILTSRNEYFAGTEEEKRVLRPSSTVIETRSTQYDRINLITWNDEQVDLFLERRVPLIAGARQPWTHYRDSIKGIPDLSDLSKRPVLLDMIARTLPDLIASGKPIDRPNLYETYLLGEMKRQRILKRRELLLSEEARFSLLERLSLDIYFGTLSAISYGEGLLRVSEFLNPPKSELAAYTREFLSCSFLMRKGDDYRFSHTSIMEYLTAKALSAEIRGKFTKEFPRRPLTPVVTGFLTEMNPSTTTLWEWIESTKVRPIYDQNHLGGNAATLLCALDKSALKGRDLSGAALIGADLSLADLTETKLAGTLMVNVNLMNARFTEDVVREAQLQTCIGSAFLMGNIGDELEQQRPGYRSQIATDMVLTAFAREPDLSVLTWSLSGSGEQFLFWFIFTILENHTLRAIPRLTASNPWITGIFFFADQTDELRGRLPKPLNHFLEQHIQLRDIPL